MVDISLLILAICKTCKQHLADANQEPDQEQQETTVVPEIEIQPCEETIPEVKKDNFMIFYILLDVLL